MPNITWKQWQWFKHIAKPVSRTTFDDAMSGTISNDWVHIHHIEQVDRLCIDALVLEGLVERKKEGDSWVDEWRTMVETFGEWDRLLDNLDIDEPTEKDLNNFE